MDNRIKSRSAAWDVSTGDAGQKLKQVRDRLQLTTREVEDASRVLAEQYQNDEFVIPISRLSELENKGVVPSVYRLYALCVIYRLDPGDVLEWYGINLGATAGDSLLIEHSNTHVLRFKGNGRGEVPFPLKLDPGVDVKKSVYLSRMIQSWGSVPLSLFSGLELKDHQYAYIGTDDWTMYPILYPGSLVLIDESRKKIIQDGWTTEFERPIYFLEHDEGWACGWCSLHGKRLVIQPHPASPAPSQVFGFPGEIEVVGQVTGVAMRLGPGRKPRGRA